MGAGAAGRARYFFMIASSTDRRSLPNFKYERFLMDSTISGLPCGGGKVSILNGGTGFPLMSNFK